MQAQPKHPDANHNLGVGCGVGKPLKLFCSGWLWKLTHIEQFCCYIDALIKVERLDEARRVLAEGKRSGVTTEKLKLFRQQTQTSPSEDKRNTKKGLALSEKRNRLAEKKKKKLEKQEVHQQKQSRHRIKSIASSRIIKPVD